MTELEALLAGIVSEPADETRWLVLADWLEENDDVRRGELMRLHRKLLATCCEPGAPLERAAWHSRVVGLIGEGVRPCVPQKTFLLPGGVSMIFAFIPPGSFRMGSDHPEGYGNEKPVHRVTLTQGFFMGVHPVTQSQWQAVLDTNPSHFKGKDRPFETVSWDDCQEFCRELTVSQGGRFAIRLPTEAEWECACRAGTTTEYHFGDVINPDLVNYNGKHSWNGSPTGAERSETAEVGSYPCNPWGLSDMHGNVWEWCEDASDEEFYTMSPAEDPVRNIDREMGRVLRGGAWGYIPGYCRAAFRFSNGRGSRRDMIGCRACFRLD